MKNGENIKRAFGAELDGNKEAWPHVRKIPSFFSEDF